ncbi:MAG: hypothetical protein R2750_05840 [Bacteroidales bacterium]
MPTGAIDFTWNTDQYGYESSFYVMSPQGTQCLFQRVFPVNLLFISLDAFNGEQMQGTWRIWITDSYGDGGHQSNGYFSNHYKNVYSFSLVDT